MSPPEVTSLAFALMGFLAGSLPFSVWIGKWALRTDIRRYGDHNPGASNVIRAGSKTWGIAAVLLDGFKGAIPVGIAYFGLGLSGWLLVPVAIAPVVGHAFSPLLRFQGGKAVAVTFGIWTGLTIYQGPTVLGLFLGLWVYLLGANGWAVMATMLSWLGFLVMSSPGLSLAGERPELLPTLLAIWTLNVLILAWKHRHDFRQRPALRRWSRRHSPQPDHKRSP